MNEPPPDIAKVQGALPDYLAGAGVRSRAVWGARATKCTDLDGTKTRMAVHHTVSMRSAAGELVLFANDGELLALSATEDAHVILLAGEPIDEPIVQYGPFVMNTVDEIQQAIIDVNRGKLGPIPE